MRGTGTGDTLTINYTIMKKTFRNLFLAVGAFALAAVGMTSCNDDPDPDGDTQWGDYEFVVGQYTKGDDGVNVFLFAIQTTGIEESGEGEFITFQLFANSEMELKEGDYTLMGDTPEDLTFCPGGMTMTGGIGGTSIQYIEGNEAVDYDLVEEGTVSIKKGSDGEWELKANFPGCQTEEVNYKGEIVFEDVTPQPDYSNETTATPAGDYTFTSALGVQGNGQWLIEVSSDTNPFELAHILIYSNTTSVSDLFGKTYNVDFSGDLNTAAASNGMMEQAATYSYLYINCVDAEQEGYFQPGGVYYLVSGTVTIDASGMLSFDCKSHGGHTIKGTCSAALQQGSMGAPRKVVASEAAAPSWAKSLAR